MKNSTLPSRIHHNPCPRHRRDRVLGHPCLRVYCPHRPHRQSYHKTRRRRKRRVYSSKSSSRLSQSREQKPKGSPQKSQTSISSSHSSQPSSRPSSKQSPCYQMMKERSQSPRSRHLCRKYHRHSMMHRVYSSHSHSLPSPVSLSPAYSPQRSQ